MSSTLLGEKKGAMRKEIREKVGGLENRRFRGVHLNVKDISEVGLEP